MRNSRATSIGGRWLPATLDLVLVVYQKTLSLDHSVWGKRIPLRFCCFQPSCSQYMREAIAARGAFGGTLMGLWRIIRCNPFSRGGHDPAPIR